MDCARPVAVVSDDRQGMPAVLGVMLERHGFRVVPAGDFRGLCTAVGELHPDVVVVALTVCGSRGVKGVGVLHALEPSSPIVVLSPFPGLSRSLLVAGAHSVVGEDDLQALERIVAASVTARDAAASGVACVGAGQAPVG